MNKFKVAIACAVLLVSALANAEIKANELAHKNFSGEDDNGPARLEINADLSWRLLLRNSKEVYKGPSIETTEGYGGAGTFVILIDGNNSRVMSLGTRAERIGDLDKLEYSDLVLKLEQ